MIKKVILGLGLVSMMAFSGCSSDTEESIEKDAIALMAECNEKGKAIDDRMKAFKEDNK